MLCALVSQMNAGEAHATDPMIAVRRGLPLSRQPFGVIAFNRRLTSQERTEYQMEKDYMVHGATLPTRKLSDVVDELIHHDESRTDEKLRQMIAAADAEADGDDGREPGDTRDEESLEDHNIQGLGAYRDVFDADGEQ